MGLPRTLLNFLFCQVLFLIGEHSSPSRSNWNLAQLSKRESVLSECAWCPDTQGFWISRLMRVWKVCMGNDRNLILSLDHLHVARTIRQGQLIKRKEDLLCNVQVVLWEELRHTKLGVDTLLRWTRHLSMNREEKIPLSLYCLTLSN